MIRCVVSVKMTPAGVHDSEMPHAGHQRELFLFPDAWLTRGPRSARALGASLQAPATAIQTPACLSSSFE